MPAPARFWSTRSRRTRPGSDVLRNLKVTDSVPTGTSFLSAGQGGTHSACVASWNLGSTVVGSHGEIGALDYIFALSAKDSQLSYRYDISANTWTARANIPAKVNWGGALTTDGNYIYALPAKDSQSSIATTSAPTLGRLGEHPGQGEGRRRVDL